MGRTQQAALTAPKKAKVTKKQAAAAGAAQPPKDGDQVKTHVLEGGINKPAYCRMGAKANIVRFGGDHYDAMEHLQRQHTSEIVRRALIHMEYCGRRTLKAPDAHGALLGMGRRVYPVH